MGSTPNFAWPYPEGGDTPDVPRDLEALAVAMDASFSTVFSGANFGLYRTTQNAKPPFNQTGGDFVPFTAAAWPPLTFTAASKVVVFMIYSEAANKASTASTLRYSFTITPTISDIDPIQASVGGTGRPASWVNEDMCSKISVSLNAVPGQQYVLQPSWRISSGSATTVTTNATGHILAICPGTQATPT